MATRSKRDTVTMIKGLMKQYQNELESYKLSGIVVHHQSDHDIDFRKGSYGSIVELDWHGALCVGKELHTVFFDIGTRRDMECVLRKFCQEIKMLSGMKHPNIVQFFGIYYSEITSLPVMVMESLQFSLHEFLKTSEKESVTEFTALNILFDVSKGLVYLHEVKKVAHRDLSSNNILLTTNLCAKIADLGSARVLDRPGGWSPIACLTMQPGTKDFMPPEALEDPPRYTVSVDVFSFGCVIIHLCTYQWPTPIGKVSKGKPISEYERRFKYVSMMGESHFLISLVKSCLQDEDVKSRPTSKNVMLSIQNLMKTRHPESTIKKLQNAGLGYYVGRNETKHKLGTIPLRELVYRVLDLPPSMQQYVFDFGKLSDTAEENYIKQIVSTHLGSMEMRNDISKDAFIKAVVKVLNFSQLYIKLSQTEWNFISLRDIERTMVIFKWFYENHDMFDLELRKYYKELKECQAETRALILSLAVNYHARLTDKSNFEKEVCSQMQSPLQEMEQKEFVDEIIRFQEMLLSQMQLGENIARNAALRENVFMMVVCVELRIPLFVVGKPGSSKSLAKSIVANSMRGKASSKSLLQMFKQVQLFSYQCSKHSTPDGILEVFQQAMDYQKAMFKQKDNESTNQKSNFVSAVVLDEVGLAEDSPSLPLKVLHPLLEDGTSADDNLATTSKVDRNKDLAIDIIPREDRVAFIGISNWALDPAKMNRGVMIIRGGTDKKELIESAGEICSSDKNDKIRMQLSNWFEKLANLFLKLCQKQEKEFFGLRDFYSAIKMLYWMMKKTLDAVPESDRDNVLGKLPTSKQLRHAILRNFSGYKEVDPFSHFSLPEMDKFEYTHNEILHHLEPDCSPLGLIKRSLSSNERDCHGESRYLLFLTENYAALRIFYQYLSDSKSTPTIIFGSSFPRDQEYTQICCNISKIKLCMETGQTVVLLQLGNLYESLYDLLNQYYSYMGSSRFVDLGLSSHRIKSKVHDNFKLVVIAEKEKVHLHEEFPTPLINRLEKHFLVMSTILISPSETTLVTKCLEWVERFSCSCYNGYSFTEQDAFVGYQEDTCAAVVYSCINETKYYDEVSKTDDASLEIINLKWCQRELLNLATPDAVIRSMKSMSEDENGFIQNTYFTEQSHSCMVDFLAQQLEYFSFKGLLLQVLTYGPLLSKLAIHQMLRSLNIDQENCKDYNLLQFDTEMDFCNAIRQFLSKQSIKMNYNPLRVSCDQATKLVILQCEFGDQNFDLIASVKQRIMDLQNEISKKFNYSLTHIALIVALPRKPGGTRFVGFQGGNWKSVYIDDLLPPITKIVSVENATSVKSIGDLLLNKSLYSKSGRFFNPVHKIRTRIQSAVSCIQDTEEHKERTGKRISLLLKLIPTQPLSSEEEMLLFHEVLAQKLGQILKERDELNIHQQEWIFKEATSIKNLQEGGTLRRALNNVMDNLIDTFFSQILEFIDRHQNLDILDSNNNENALVSQLWLYLFETKSICSFLYKEIATRYGSEQQRGRVLPGLGKSLSNWKFKCQFPFSWKVSENIESFEVVLTKTGEKLDKNSYAKLNEMLKKGSDLEKCFNAFSENVSLDFSNKTSLLELYLHDFVNLKFEKLGQHEVKVLSNAIYSQALIVNPAISDENEEWSLLDAFAAIHISFHCINHQLIIFKQIAASASDIVLQLKSEIEFPANEMIIAFQAVEKLLKVLEPDFKGWKIAKIRNWSMQIITSAAFVSEILEFKCEPESKAAKYQESIRQTWQKLQAVYLFTDNVLLSCPYHSVIQDMAATIWASLKRGTTDFTKSKTFEKIQSTIKMKEVELRKTEYSEKRHQYGHFLACCGSFLMEIISTLSFGPFQANPPETSLIQYIMEVYYNAEDPDLAVLPVKHSGKKEKRDHVILRSSILQLLLTFDLDLVRSHLQNYLEHILDVSHKIELKVQCVECLEDSLRKNYGHLTESELASKCRDLLQEGQIQMDESEVFSKLEGIAKIRFGLVAGAQLLINYIEIKDLENTDAGFKMKLHRFFNAMDAFCSNENYKDGADFLVKVVMKHGKPYLDDIFQSTVYDFYWIYPERLRKQDENYAPFVIYGSPYEDILKILNDCLQLNQWNTLSSNLHDNPCNNGTLLTLAVYSCVTISNVIIGKDSENKQTEKLVSLISTEAEVCIQLKSALKLLITNKQGRNLDSLSVYKGKKLKDNMLSSIIFHAMAVLYCKEDDVFLQPFTNILFRPDVLKETYMPAMPEDLEYKLAKVITEKVGMYRCPNGHVYFIGNCTKPWVLAKCDRCGAQIGGTDHKLAAGSTRIDLEQLSVSSKRGYDLKEAHACNETPYSERELPTADFIAMRLIMHALLTWTVCNNSEYVSSVSEAMSIKSDNLPKFFWDHLLRDLKQLHTVLHCRIEEAALLIHVILKEISVLEKRSGLTGSLSTLETRNEWEKDFLQFYVSPLVKTLPDENGEVKSAAKQSAFYTPELQDVLYEKTTDDGGLKALWRFRDQISLDHLRNTMEQHKRECAKYEILNKFLSKETCLRAVQNLPDIIHLQKILYDHFNHRKDYEEAEQWTVMEFLNDLESDVMKEIIKKKIDSFNRSWKLCRHEIINSGSNAEERKILESLKEVTSSSSMLYLIPTTYGCGLCSSILTIYLAEQHNYFIKFCLDSSDYFHRITSNEVLITQLQENHVMQYEKHLLDVILSHSHYSYELGKGRDIKYDYESIEAHFVRKFVVEKPLLDLSKPNSIPVVVFKGDLFTKEMILKIKKTVSPQHPLPKELQTSIIDELNTQQTLAQNLNVVVTVLGCLLSTGGPAEKPLQDYIQETLQMKQKFSVKVKQSCTLGNILSLWELLSVENGKQHVLNGQDPFDATFGECKKSLSEGGEEGEENQVKKLEDALQQLDVNQLLCGLYNFIVTFARFEPHVLRISLKEVFTICMEEEYELDEIPNGFEKVFPDSILVNQAVEVWKIAAKFKKKPTSDSH